jgi:CRISPR/Cas system CSM-associated protein Csm3 (group 7 of RAMP superfamily)
MARNIASRLVVEGTLVALTPLHVGGFGTNPDTDLPLAQNGRGRWHIPGTSLAGVFRSWCSRHFPDLVDPLFGPSLAKNQPVSGHASFVTVEDAEVESWENVVIEIRDGVGIHRITGTAAEGAKFDRAILPRGTRVKLRMLVEIRHERTASVEWFVASLLQALNAGEIEFGAAVTRGLGRMKLDAETRIQIQDFSSKAGFLKFLKNDSPAFSLSEYALRIADCEPVRPSNRLGVTVEWRPLRTVMVKEGFDGIGVKMLPLTSGDGDAVSFVIPGSSIKGVLRSHAERIVRTLLNFPPSADFLQQVEIPLIKELFGARNESSATRETNCKGAFSVQDCYGTNQFPRNKWQAVISAKVDPALSGVDQELHQAIDEIGKEQLSVSHHVAIDRWTGGAAAGALFSALEPTRQTFDPIKFSLDLNRIPENLTRPVLALVLLLLRDMAKSRIPIGFGTNRGLGEIVVTDISFATDSLPNDLQQVLHGVAFDAVLQFRGKAIQSLEMDWRNWVESGRK